MRALLLAGVMAFGLIGGARATTINFNSSPTGDFVYMTVGDYVLFGASNKADEEDAEVQKDAGQNAIVVGNRRSLPSADFTIGRADGQLFNFESFDYVMPNVTPFSVTVNDVLRVSRDAYNFAAFSYQTVLTPDLVNVQYVDFHLFTSGRAPGLGVTNFVVDLAATSVPEPASLALLGAGIVGAGVVRRRRAASAV